MARHPSLLANQQPTAIVPAQITIGHVQLRDLIICPRESGVVNYIQTNAIVEHNVRKPDSPPRTIADLEFTPNCLTSLMVNDGADTLLAAGGQEAEIHLSLHTHSPSSTSGATSSLTWQYDRKLHGSINNSAFLTGLSLTRAHESAVEPRVGISNNDFSVKIYDVPMRITNQKRALKEVGSVRLDVPVNHSSISPDGQTLLSVGDSAKLHLHHISGSSSKLNFTHLHTIPLPAPLPPTTANLAASFSTSFSKDGVKFAVGSQEGVVAVYDVRSVARPMKVIQTDKARGGEGIFGADSMAAWGPTNDDPWEWARGGSKAPGWSVRNVKFANMGQGREVLVFTEHTSYIHVLDAATFQTDELIRVPVTSEQPLPTSPLAVQSRPHFPSSSHRTSSTFTPSRSRRMTQQQVADTIVERYRASQSSPPSNSRFSPPQSIGDSTWRTLQAGGMMRGRSREEYERDVRMHAREFDRAREEEEEEEDEGGMVVIPPLGDRALESDVHLLLEGHGISTRRVPWVEHEDRQLFAFQYPRDDDMDVDEDEERDECTYSRSTSPSPGLSNAGSANARMGSFTSAFANAPSASWVAPSLLSASPNSWSSSSLELPPIQTTPTEQSRDRGRGELTYPEDLDIAGVCLDPSGGSLYVGTTKGVVEWGMRGAGKAWFHTGALA